MPKWRVSAETPLHVPTMSPITTIDQPRLLRTAGLYHLVVLLAYNEYVDGVLHLSISQNVSNAILLKHGMQVLVRIRVWEVGL